MNERAKEVGTLTGEVAGRQLQLETKVDRIGEIPKPSAKTSVLLNSAGIAIPTLKEGYEYHQPTQTFDGDKKNWDVFLKKLAAWVAHASVGFSGKDLLVLINSRVAGASIDNTKAIIDLDLNEQLWLALVEILDSVSFKGVDDAVKTRDAVYALQILEKQFRASIEAAHKITSLDLLGMTYADYAAMQPRGHTSVQHWRIARVSAEKEQVALGGILGELNLKHQLYRGLETTKNSGKPLDHFKHTYRKLEKNLTKKDVAWFHNEIDEDSKDFDIGFSGTRINKKKNLGAKSAAGNKSGAWTAANKTGGRESKTPSTNATGVCGRCGENSHVLDDCTWPTDVKCNSCGNKGHITKICDSISAKRKQRYKKRVLMTEAKAENEKLVLKMATLKKRFKKSKRKEKSSKKKKREPLSSDSSSDSDDTDSEMSCMLQYDNGKAKDYSEVVKDGVKGGDVGDMFAVLPRSARRDSRYMLLDSCSDEHHCGPQHAAGMKDFLPLNGPSVKGAGPSKIPVLGKGTIKRKVEVDGGAKKTLTIRNIKVLGDLDVFLLSMSKLEARGFVMSKGMKSMKTPTGVKIPIVRLGGFPAIRADALYKEPELKKSEDAGKRH